MFMEFLITEKQLAKILLEERDNSLQNSMKTLYNFTKEMVSKVTRIYGVNLRMFLTWGTSVGGLMLPLDAFLKTGEFNLDENQKMLILAGVTFALFFEGKRGLTKILTTIKENGLEEAFDAGLLKAYQLKDSFTNFLRSTKVITSQVLEIISYAFLIPIIGDVQNMAGDVTNITESSIMIAERLAASGAVLLSREVLVSLFKKLFKKLQ